MSQPASTASRGSTGSKGDIARLCLSTSALAIWERALGPDHPHVAIGLNNLAFLCMEQGKYAEALPLYERAVSIAEAALGPEHPNTKVLRKNLKACQDAMHSKG